MRNLWLKAVVAWRLGLLNIGRVLWYRARLKTRTHSVQRLDRTIGGTSFFRAPESTISNISPSEHWTGKALYFGCHQKPIGDEAPDWHENPITGQRVENPERPWWELTDFDSGAGDIKTVWETSRFDWVPAFAQRAACGDRKSLDRLNFWLADWCERNPCYRGPNWKCGQEAAIRVMHLLLGARFLGRVEQPEPALVQLVEAHLARIRPTIQYAVGQDNNHATSEAAALFMGGHFCQQQGIDKGGAWHRTGRRLLENRVARLIAPCGSFSQHSVNYHRLLLDTLSLAELWRRWYRLPAFSLRFQQRVRAATEWLVAMVDSKTGDAPNLGANDGANLLPLTDADYRDYRPCAQLAHALFLGTRVYPDEGFHKTHLRWLGLEADGSPALGEGPAIPGAAFSELRSDRMRAWSFHARGYMVLAMGPWRVLFRYPHYRFRPGHCDALHVDLWHDGRNLLRDAGSYSYNAEPALSAYFSGPAGHNVIEFDGRDHMPRLSRFLRGAWLKTEALEGPVEHPGRISAAAAFRDWQGARHRREMTLTEQGLRVVDEVGDMQERALLRWRLSPGDWRINDGTACRDGHLLRIRSSVPMEALRIVTGMESRYYLHKNPLPVLEAEFSRPCRIISEYSIDG